MAIRKTSRDKETIGIGRQICRYWLALPITRYPSA